MRNRRLQLSPEMEFQRCLLKRNCLAEFLITAIEAIASTRKRMKETEMLGFSFCVDLLRETVTESNKAGKTLQEMEARNGDY